MKTQLGTKRLGSVAAVAAIALSLPLAVNAYGDPEPSPTPTTAAPTSTSTSEVPKPQGSGCDSYYQQLPNGANSLNAMSTEPVGTALANDPLLTTFNAAISGQLNPEVNLVSILNNGPYIVFAPVNDAFAKLPPERLEALKTDGTALTNLLFYHMVLGILGPDDVHGKLTTQQGKQVEVTGKGGDIKVDNAKVLCGAIRAKDARIYLIDSVLDPASVSAETATSTAETTTSTAETATSTAATPTSEAPSTTTTAATA